MMTYDAIPQELKDITQWVVWKLEERNGKSTKVPFQVNGEHASVSDPSTWTTFSLAVEASPRFSGIGFVFTSDDPYAGIDLDGKSQPVFDQETGELNPQASNIVSRLDSYTETSQSGKGLHVIVKGRVPQGGNRKGDLEMYDAGRYFCMTGNRLVGAPDTINERSRELVALHRQIFANADECGNERPLSQKNEVPLDDKDLLMHARGAKNGSRFAALMDGGWTGYGSQSEADLALCNHLAFWTGRDPARIDRLFRRSGLFREKWDEPHCSTGQTYGEHTIQKAIQGCCETYNPSCTQRLGNGHGHENVEERIRVVLASDDSPKARAKQSCALAARLTGLDRAEAMEQIKKDTKLPKPAIREEIERAAALYTSSSATMAPIIHDYVVERLAPRFIVYDKTPLVWSEVRGFLMRQGDFCSMTTSSMLERIREAADYPRPTPNDPTKPIRHAQQVLRQVWSDIIAEAPREAGHTGLGPASKAAGAFRLRVEGIWHSPETWMKFSGNGSDETDGPHVERMSLASRVRQLIFHAKRRAPKWQRVLRGVNAFFRVENEVVWLGMRADLCAGEIKGQRILSVQKPRDLTVLMKRYGLSDSTDGVTDRMREGSDQQRLVVLSRELTDYLIECADPICEDQASQDESGEDVTVGLVAHEQSK